MAFPGPKTRRPDRRVVQCEGRGPPNAETTLAHIDVDRTGRRVDLTRPRAAGQRGAGSGADLEEEEEEAEEAGAAWR